MYLNYSILFGIFVIAYQILLITATFELTNIKCISYDENFLTFDYCRIKSVNRTYKYFSVKIKLLQKVTKVDLNIVTYKRYNGYKPSLYNFTFDVCKYVASKNRNPLHSYFFNFFGQHSNMNHTCPYDHDVIVDKVSIGYLNHYTTSVLPISKGDHAIYATWYLNGKKRAEVRVYATLT